MIPEEKPIIREKSEIIYVKMAEAFHQEVPLPPPCVCSAEDLAQASDSAQIEKMAPPDVANNILEIILSYENKLNHAFANPPIENKKELKKENPQTQKKSPRESAASEVHRKLDDLPPVQLLGSSISAEFGMHDILSINTNVIPCTISKYKFVHPLQSANDFNGSISELSQLILSIQHVFKIKCPITVIPLPLMPILRVKDSKFRLWFNSSLEQRKELTDLSFNISTFIQYIGLITKEAAKMLKQDEPEIHESILPKLILSTNMDEINHKWNDSAVEILSLARLCIHFLSLLGDQVY